MSKFVTMVGWGDVPHLTTEDIQDMLDEIPEYEIDARSKGWPSLGSGNIYHVRETKIRVEDFTIPDHWPLGYGLDVGWNWTACAWFTKSPETGTYYIYRVYKKGKREPSDHAGAIMAQGAWIHGVIDPAANGRGQKDGWQLIEAYRRLGLHLQGASSAVDGGILKVNSFLDAETLKVFESCHDWWDEYRRYRRDLNGNIVKKNDHLMDCHDRETEVLTASGWKRFPEVLIGESVATLNMQTDELEYQSVTDKVEYTHAGKMVEIKGHKLNALITPNHRCVVYEREKGKPSFRVAADLRIWDRIKLHSKGWKGSERNDPVEVDEAHGKPATIDPLVWAELLGWYIAEGSFAARPRIPGTGYAVQISQRETSAVIGRLRQLLEETPWRWIYNGTDFYTSSKWLWEYVREFGKARDKYVPVWVRESEPRVIQAFLDGAISGDGWLQNGVSTYSTISKRLADGIQELWIKLGKSASVRIGRKAGWVSQIGGRTVEAKNDQWWVREWDCPHGLLRDSTNNPNYTEVEYVGPVYCLSVPNKTLVTRRHGKPLISGNSTRYFVLSGLDLLYIKGKTQKKIEVRQDRYDRVDMAIRRGAWMI